MCCDSSEKHLQRLIREPYQAEKSEGQRRFVCEIDAPYLKSVSWLINGRRI